MPSTVVLEKKKAQVAALTDRIKGSCAGVVVEYKGINVADDTKLRKELREAGVVYTVVKNSILQRAAENAGLELEGSVLEGTTAVATSEEDYVAAARILNTYAERHDNFNIKTGYLDGAIIDNAKIISLAKLPSREILLATVCNAFNAPISAFARVVQAIVDEGGIEECLAKKAPAEEAPAEEAAPAEETAPAAEAPAEETAE
ncbi:MAG: 50S ribosomal protein L10 [Eubacterium sp.]|nr:50S ribosomal protein L10 [Eubacterium sp.]